MRTVQVPRAGMTLACIPIHGSLHDSIAADRLAAAGAAGGMSAPGSKNLANWQTQVANWQSHFLADSPCAPQELAAFRSHAVWPRIFSCTIPAARPESVDFPGDFLDKLRAGSYVQGGQLVTYPIQELD